MSALSATAPPAKRLPHILAALHAAYPDACCALTHINPFQLLMATILSAQCTDERVNQVTRVLFPRYPTPEAMAAADRDELEAIVRPTGYFHQKARYLQEASQILLAEYDGTVPADMAALMTLPGVSRKTANVVLGTAFRIAEGIVVDTHVKRLAGRLGLTAETAPEKIERDLMALVPRESWIDVSHLLIFHGRQVCQARKPDCIACPINHLCPAAQI